MIELVKVYVLNCDWPAEECRARLTIHGEGKLKIAIERARKDGWTVRAYRTVRCPRHAWRHFDI